MEKWATNSFHLTNDKIKSWKANNTDTSRLSYINIQKHFKKKKERRGRNFVVGTSYSKWHEEYFGMICDWQTKKPDFFALFKLWLMQILLHKLMMIPDYQGSKVPCYLHVLFW